MHPKSSYEYFIQHIDLFVGAVAAPFLHLADYSLCGLNSPLSPLFALPKNYSCPSIYSNPNWKIHILHYYILILLF